jgi:hypothetical protein
MPTDIREQWRSITLANHKIMRFGTAGQWMVVLDGDRGMPEGGFPRQTLAKTSATDYIAQWGDPAGFTYTQGQAPTLSLDGTSALPTGVTWWDTTTNNGYVRVANAWVQFSWGDSEARYVNVIGDTLTGQLSGIAPTAAPHLTRKDYVDTQVATAAASATAANTNANSRVARTGDTMTGNLGMAGTSLIDFAETLGTKLDLYGGSYTLGIENSTLRYRSGGTHQFTGSMGTDGRIDAAGHIVANSSVYANLSSNGARHGVWMGDWGGGRGDGWSGLVGSRGYILIGFYDGSGGNMHVRGNNNLYIGGGSTDDMYFTGTGIRSIRDHYFSAGISVDGGSTVASNGSFGGKTGIGSWASDGNYCCVWGHYGYHLMGKGGVDGAVHTRGNNAGWNHYIGAGSYIQLEQWTIAALGGGSGGTVVQKLDGVLANAASRRILKEQIEPLPEKVDAGAVIDALEPVTFIWRKRDDVMSQFYAMQRSHMDMPHEGEYGPVCIPEEVAAAVPYYDDDAAEVWRKADLRIGLIADDVAVVRPELANWEWEKDADGKNTDELIPGSWNEQAMISVLIQGVKDLRARVASLEAAE